MNQHGAAAVENKVFRLIGSRPELPHREPPLDFNLPRAAWLPFISRRRGSCSRAIWDAFWFTSIDFIRILEGIALAWKNFPRSSPSLSLSLARALFLFLSLGIQRRENLRGKSRGKIKVRNMTVSQTARSCVFMKNLSLQRCINYARRVKIYKIFKMRYLIGTNLCLDSTLQVIFTKKGGWKNAALKRIWENCLWMFAVR